MKNQCNVAVVGLGAAGLRAAMLLRESGLSIELFESQNRIGGRLQTIDEGDGCLFEAGGEWIDGDHHRVLNLLRQFSHDPLPASVWPKSVLFEGKRKNEVDIWADALEDEVRIDSMAKEMAAELSVPSWESYHCEEWDSIPLDRFLAENTRSLRGNWWLTAKLRSDEGDDLENIGLLGWLSGYRLYLDRDADVMSAYRFPRGSTHFCQAMLKSVQMEPHIGWTLERVSQSPSGIQLVFDKGSWTADHVILALPPRAVERITFDAALPPAIRCSLEACEMSPAVKVVWQFEEPWWLNKNWGGSMLCDSPIQQTWASGLAEGSSCGNGVPAAPLLSAYVCGQAARDLAKSGDPVRSALYDLSLIEPDAAKTFRRGWFYDWNQDPCAGGAFSHLAPNYVLQHQAHIAKAVGNIHFAGEHTSEWIGFIEGALESAERAVKEITEHGPH